MIYLSVGRRELGKTTLALYLTRNVRPRVVFDPRGLCPAPFGRTTTIGEVQLAFDGLREDIDNKGGLINRAEIVITPDRELQPCFEFMCGEVKSWLQDVKLPIAFVVDESTFVDLNVDAFEWIIRCAPRRSAHIVLTQHRPFDVPIRIRSIVDVWCVFRQVEPRDLNVIAERCTPAFADKVSKLRPREFMSWDDTKPDNNVGIYLEPAAWFTPLAEPPTGSGVAGKVDLPPSNSTLQKNIALPLDGA